MSKKYRRSKQYYGTGVHHLFTHLSEFAVRDNTNKWSYINVVQNVALDQIPGAIVSLFVSVGFTGGDGENFSVAIEDPNGSDMFRSKEEKVVAGSVSHPLMRSSFNATLMMSPAVFLLEGVYHVVLRVSGKEIHREPFGVLKGPASEAGDKNASSK